MFYLIFVTPLFYVIAVYKSVYIEVEYMYFNLHTVHMF